TMYCPNSRPPPPGPYPLQIRQEIVRRPTRPSGGSCRLGDSPTAPGVVVMPVFVACPACGCRVQMTEAMIGKSVRCIACSERFAADPEVQPPPPPPRRVPAGPVPAGPEAPRRGPSPPGADEEFGPDGRPFCP